MAMQGQQIEMIGFTAAFLTTAAFVPKLVRVLKLRSAPEMSLPTFSTFSAGVVMWLLYGIYRGSVPMIVSNSLTLALTVGILLLKVKYDHVAKALKP